MIALVLFFLLIVPHETVSVVNSYNHFITPYMILIWIENNDYTQIKLCLVFFSGNSNFIVVETRKHFTALMFGQIVGLAHYINVSIKWRIWMIRDLIRYIWKKTSYELVPAIWVLSTFVRHEWAMCYAIQKTVCALFELLFTTTTTKKLIIFAREYFNWMDWKRRQKTIYLIQKVIHEQFQECKLLPFDLH